MGAEQSVVKVDPHGIPFLDVDLPLVLRNSPTFKKWMREYLAALVETNERKLKELTKKFKLLFEEYNIPVEVVPGYKHHILVWQYLDTILTNRFNKTIDLLIGELITMNSRGCSPGDLEKMETRFGKEMLSFNAQHLPQMSVGESEDDYHGRMGAWFKHRPQFFRTRFMKTRQFLSLLADMQKRQDELFLLVMETATVPSTEP